MDKLFGTFYLPKDRLPEKYGIDAPMAQSCLGQPAQPFRGKRKPAPAPDVLLSPTESEAVSAPL
jgi:hypothetical protein